MVATLEVMYALPDELPPLTASYKRRAGYKLEGEWTRSVQYISLAHTVSNFIQYFWSGVVVSALASINKVNLRRSRLVWRWATVSGFSSLCRTLISV